MVRPLLTLTHPLFCFEMLVLIRVLCLIAFVFSPMLLAQEQSSCAKNDLGQVFCAPPGGGAVNTVSGVFCGPGRCTTDDLGRVICSAKSNGGVLRDDLGRVVCVGGCILATREFCEQLK